VKLFRKNSNLCDHNSPTLQTDRQTDDMRWQYRALHSSASRGKNCAIFEPSCVSIRQFG